MHKLRNFIVELLFVGVFVGWLVTKYPTTIDTVIPWILLAILWHVTWEFVLQSEYVKSIVAVRRWGRMAWVIAFLAGGVISTAYW